MDHSERNGDLYILKKKGLAVTGDVSVEADVERLVGETVKELGGVDVMVANAGIAAASPLIECTCTSAIVVG